VNKRERVAVGAFPKLQTFRLAFEGIRCDEDGLFVGSTPTLRRSPRADGFAFWSVRARDELNDELSQRYGLPIEIDSKRTGLEGVARALQGGDLALAQIATLLLRLPDPPPLNKGAPAVPSEELAKRLFESGLLKGDWDPNLHPRTDQSPNSRWFAAKPKISIPAGNPLAPTNESPGAEEPGASTEGRRQRQNRRARNH
jgi:hypothetical protein